MSTSPTSPNEYECGKGKRGKRGCSSTPLYLTNSIHVLVLKAAASRCKSKVLLEKEEKFGIVWACIWLRACISSPEYLKIAIFIEEFYCHAIYPDKPLSFGPNNHFYLVRLKSSCIPSTSLARICDLFHLIHKNRV